jgi:hypothetical protein
VRLFSIIAIFCPETVLVFLRLPQNNKLNIYIVLYINIYLDNYLSSCHAMEKGAIDLISTDQELKNMYANRDEFDLKDLQRIRRNSYH